jgi:hypothetical protein
MDEPREDMARIHVDSLRDWRRMKTSFGKAILDQFDQRIRQSGLESERDALLPYAQQVEFGFSMCVYIFSLGTMVVHRRDF